MKKRLVFAICGCMLMLAACGNAKETVTTSEVEAKEVAAEPKLTAPETQEMQAGSDAEAGVITDNTITADLFEITMPEEFSGLFEAEVSEGRIDVYHKESREAGFPGLIFSIWARKSPSEFAGGPYMKVGELTAADGTSSEVVKGEATEVQWDYNQEEPESFGKMYDAFGSIIENMTATNGGTFMCGAGMKGEELYADTLAQLIDIINNGATFKFFLYQRFTTMQRHIADIFDKFI